MNQTTSQANIQAQDRVENPSSRYTGKPDINRNIQDLFPYLPSLLIFNQLFVHSKRTLAFTMDTLN